LLLGLALFDAILLGVSYNLLFLHRFGRWAGLTCSVACLIAFWLGVSYLLGRYSQPETGQRDSLRRRLLATAQVALLVLIGVVVVLSWGFKVQDPRTFRSFIAPLLTAVTMASAAAQLVWHGCLVPTEAHPTVSYVVLAPVGQACSDHHGTVINPFWSRRRRSRHHGESDRLLGSISAARRMSGTCATCEQAMLPFKSWLLILLHGVA
jgi:hypothetical protein